MTLGGDCLADIAMLRSQPELFGPIAFDPTVSRINATVLALIAYVRLNAVHGPSSRGDGPDETGKGHYVLTSAPHLRG
ncbi:MULTISPECIES: hypothetical protein [unclassified Streptosporangium]|uniref:hypothetical protein n=1 Tax=unclassified Streptosporangium TaxID=2632669 RepID=UPI002E2BA71E|nr:MULTISPECIES: hypothetical protein [unclassified Streptosporangium]